MIATLGWALTCLLCMLPFAALWLPQGQPYTGILLGGVFVGTVLALCARHEARKETP